MLTADHLAAQLDRLAAFVPAPFPVLSLYLNLQPNQHGRDRFAPFLRKELAALLKTYPPGSPAHNSLERDAARVQETVDAVDRAAHGLAIIACSGVDLFE